MYTCGRETTRIETNMKLAIKWINVSRMNWNWRWMKKQLVISQFSKANIRRSVHSPQDRFIITLIISDRRDWRDTRGKWPLVRNPGRSWWHRHKSFIPFFLAAAHGSMDNRHVKFPSRWLSGPGLLLKISSYPIPHDAGLAPIPYPIIKFPLHWRSNQCLFLQYKFKAKCFISRGHRIGTQRYLAIFRLIGHNELVMKPWDQ